MENRYCNSNESIQRLIRKWQKWKTLIVAVDFDDTIKAYDEGDSCTRVPSLLKKCQDLNFILILFTCREDRSLSEALDYCDSIGIHFNYINYNPITQYIGRKPYYDILLDDKAALGCTCNILEEAIEEIKKLI